MLQLQVNIYYEQNNKDHIYSAVYTDQNQMIKDMLFQQARLLKIIYKGVNCRFYFDNAYAKTFAIKEQFVAFPQDQQILMQFLEIVFYLAVEKKHPVIVIFLTPEMNQSVFQGEQYWQEFNHFNSQINPYPKNQQQIPWEDMNKKKNIENNTIDKEKLQKQIVNKISNILKEDYQTKCVIYAIKKIPIPSNAQQNQSIVKVAILTNCKCKLIYLVQINEIHIYSLQSDVTTTKYNVSYSNITQIIRSQVNKQFHQLERYENIIQIPNQQKYAEQYLLVFNNEIPAFQFPLDLRNR